MYREVGAPGPGRQLRAGRKSGGQGVAVLRTPAFLAVIPPVKALIVDLPADPDPVGLVDPPAIRTGRTHWKGTSDLDPSSLFSGNPSYLVGGLREILILAHYECHVVFATVGERDYVERDPDVNSLLLSHHERALRAVGQRHCSVPVSQWPAIHEDTPPPHRRELASPEEVPLGVVPGIRNPGVEAHLGQIPSLACTDPLREGRNVVVGVAMAERLPSSVEQVLTVHEDNGAFGWRLVVQWPIRGKNNPARGLSACRAGGKFLDS